MTISWPGESNEQLRAQFTIRDGQPVVQELAARDSKGTWIVLGKELSPEFQVTTGRRRISGVQRSLLKVQGIDTPEQENIRKWNTFWDAPLVMPGHHDSTDLPRLPEEIKRAAVRYKSDNCTVTTTGERVSVTFNGLSLGVFAGDLQFTAYKSSNLLRQEAIAKTEEPSVAYIYKAGLKGFTINSDTKVEWRDTARAWQEYSFGGAPNKEPVNMRARNRLEILDAGPDQAVLGVAGPRFREVEEASPAGEVFILMTVRNGHITRMRDFRSREDALAAAHARPTSS